MEPNEPTLRDLFAMFVAGSIWRDMPADTDTETCARAVAEKAYLVADEMMKARGK